MNPLDRTLLGETRYSIEEALGPPDAKGGTSRKHPTPNTWLYGTVEISFGYDGLVNMIFDDPDKGGSGKVFTRDQ